MTNNRQVRYNNLEVQNTKVQSSKKERDTFPSSLNIVDNSCGL